MKKHTMKYIRTKTLEALNDPVTIREFDYLMAEKLAGFVYREFDAVRDALYEFELSKIKTRKIPTLKREARKQADLNYQRIVREFGSLMSQI